MPIEAASSASVAPKINAASLVIGKPVNPSTTYADDDGNAVILPFPSSSAGTISPSDGGEAGKGGEGGSQDAALPSFAAFSPTNSEFCQTIFSDLPLGATPIVTAKSGDPQQGAWIAHPVQDIEQICLSDRNTYFNCASVRPGNDGEVAAKKENAAAYHALVLDDVGTKVARERLNGIIPTWELETSPGNFQIGFKLCPPLSDPQAVDALQKRIADAGLTDNGAKGMVRWMRLPNGINGKSKYEVEGRPFACKLHAWNPNATFSATRLTDTLAPIGLTPAAAQKTKAPLQRLANPAGPELSWDVYHPRSAENPVLSAFKSNRLHKSQIAPGKHEVTCPWVGEHTDKIDSGTVYFEPDEQHRLGGFRCQHSHGDKYRIRQVVDHFDLTIGQAQNRPTIRIVQGEMHNVIAAAEAVLAEQEDFFQAGGLIVKASVDARTHDWALVPVTEAEVTLLLAKNVDWEKYDRRSHAWDRCDPPARHVATLHRADRFDRLRPVIGLARQPYYRESDGTLVTTSGYDPETQRLGVFDGSKFPPVGNTKAQAVEALSLLEDLIAEFHFASPADRAGALSAFLTSTVRTGLDLAPAFHVTAPSSGSGKSYLCEVTSGFAGPGVPARMSYPKTSDEATKAIMAVLLGAPAVVEFDDMDTDWLPHGSINRMLTSQSITDRILGQSKTATVSTTALILGSGNNVGPVRDLRRRVLTINLNTRSAMPGTLRYSGNPVATLRANREMYVSAALTIIEAWKSAGCPRADVPPIASFGGAWADCCRHPLIWLGLPDPATNLIDQMRSDPEADLLTTLLTEWHRRHGEAPITIRRLLEDTYDADLQEAIADLPVHDHGKVNRSKLGWYLKRNMNRIVGGYVLEQIPSAERTSWKVAKMGGGEPASPPSLPPPAETVAPEFAF